MHELKYDYKKPKYSENDYIYKYIAEAVETRFYTSNYEIDRPLPKGRNKNVIGLMKDTLGRQIMKKFGKTYRYLKGNKQKRKSKRDKKMYY